MVDTKTKSETLKALVLAKGFGRQLKASSMQVSLGQAKTKRVEG